MGRDDEKKSGSKHEAGEEVTRQTKIVSILLKVQHT
jgi:hypothetical protein